MLFPIRRRGAPPSFETPGWGVVALPQTPCRSPLRTSGHGTLAGETSSTIALRGCSTSLIRSVLPPMLAESLIIVLPADLAAGYVSSWTDSIDFCDFAVALLLPAMLVM